MHADEIARSSRNPQSNLHGQTPRERGLRKLSLALRWALKFHVTHPTIIDQLLARMLLPRVPGQPARETLDPRFLHELTKKGYFRRFHASTLVGGAAYMLTSKGRDAGLEALGRDIPYDLHPSSVHRATLKHLLAVQRVCARYLLEIDEVTPERLMKWEGARRPDALITRNGQPVAIEVELSGKYKEELEQSLYSHAEAIRNGLCVGVLYASNSKSMLTRYQERLAAPMHAWHPYDEYGKPRTWIKGDDVVHLSPEIRQQFRFQDIPTLLRGFQVDFQGRTHNDMPQD